MHLFRVEHASASGFLRIVRVLNRVASEFVRRGGFILYDMRIITVVVGYLRLFRYLFQATYVYGIHGIP